VVKLEDGEMIRSVSISDKVRIVATVLFVLIPVAWAASPAGAGSPGEDAEAFVQELADSGVAMLENVDDSAAQRETGFRNLVRKGFALEQIGRFVVARYWRKMDKHQQAEYQEMFAEWLLMTYASRLGGFEGQRVEVVRSSELDNRHKDVVVRTRIVGIDGQPEMLADWRVRKFNGNLRIIDVIVEGVSMAAAQKSEFEAIIRKVGVDGLVENLRSQLTTMVARNN
jgi:phospholipid transport system substrate-binding protein